MARLNVLNAAINVKPQGPGAGRGQTQGNLTFSWKPGVKFPSPQAPTESQFPAPGVTFSIRVTGWNGCLFQHHRVFTTTQERQCQKMSSSAGYSNGGQDALTQT